MPDNPFVNWVQATRFGIQMDEAGIAWNSGHVNDIIELHDRSGIVVATESGGVWMIDADNDPFPLSDSWDNPDVKCLALGPDGARHLFAGCTLVYTPENDPPASSPVIMESNAAAEAPLFDWHPINSPLPVTAGRVTRIAVIRNLRRIVVACAKIRTYDTGGIFWARIPPTRFAPGDPSRPPYVWKQAKVVGFPANQGFWDLAVASTRNNPSRNNLEDRQTITLVAGGFQGGGPFVGRWDSTDELVFDRPSVTLDDGTDGTGLLFDNGGTTSVSSCENHPTVVYAACATPDGQLNGVLRSKDGGQHWQSVGVQETHATGIHLIVGFLQPMAGDQGAKWNNCISAHPTNPGMAALGWQNGTFLTLDNGTSWRQVDGGAHLHPDVHAFYFSKEIPDSIGTLFVGSDGGMARINLDDLLGLVPATVPFRSDYNRNLPTLQCYSTLVRQFYGTMTASAMHPGLIAAGVHDNGNVFCLLNPGDAPWKHAHSGDGGWNAFLADGYAHNVMGQSIQVSSQTGPSAPVLTAVVPVTSPAPGDPAGIIGPYAEVVVEPQQRNAAGQLLVAVASVANVIYGLYADPAANPAYRWEVIGAIPTGELIYALGSFDGTRVFAGTSGGKIYRLEVSSGRAVPQKVILPQPSPGTQMQGGSVIRIVGFNDNDMFALLLGATEQQKAFGVTAGIGLPATPVVVRTYVLRLDQDTWTATRGVGLPNEYTYGMVAVAAPGTGITHGLLVSTDNAVYLSSENGETWQRASLGLPRRPHCGDLRFVIDRDGGAAIYLGTFGRSVWAAKLR